MLIEMYEQTCKATSNPKEVCNRILKWMAPAASKLKVSCFFFGMVISCWFQPYDSFTMAANDEVTQLAGYRAHRMSVMCAFMAMDAEQLCGEFFEQVAFRARGVGPRLHNRKEFKRFKETSKAFETKADTEEGGQEEKNAIRATHKLFFTNLKRLLNTYNMQWFTNGLYTILGETFPNVKKKVVSEYKKRWRQLLHVVATNQKAWLQTSRTATASWEERTTASNGALCIAVDRAIDFANCAEFKSEYIQLFGIDHKWSCFEVFNFIATKLKAGVSAGRLKAVHALERIGGAQIRFVNGSENQKESVIKSHYQLWPKYVLDDLTSDATCKEFAEENVFGMMNHSTITERAVKQSKIIVGDRSQLSSKMLSLLAICASSRKGLKNEVAADVPDSNGFVFNAKHVEKYCDSVIATPVIPLDKLEHCREGFGEIYEESPEKLLIKDKADKLKQSVAGYEGIKSRSDVSLAEQNDQTTVGATASGKLPAATLQSTDNVTHFLLSYGFAKDDLAGKKYDQLKRMAKPYMIQSADKKKYYWQLNKACIGGRYAYSVENREKPLKFEERTGDSTSTATAAAAASTTSPASPGLRAEKPGETSDGNGPAAKKQRVEELPVGNRAGGRQRKQSAKRRAQEQ